MQGHIELLAACGVEHVVVGVGYRHHLIEAELNRLSGVAIETVFNPDYREGNIVTLLHLRAHLSDPGPVLLMDADVLYDERLLDKLMRSEHDNCLLLDEDCDADEEPVKVWVSDGKIVDFGKLLKTTKPFEGYGESVGFFKFSPSGARQLVRACETFIERRECDALYEEAIRELVLSESIDSGFELVTGLPWTEIDFHSDLDKARRLLLPRLRESDSRVAAG